jgi:predicted DNA-binding protein (MmcQ/YjbR family)
MDAEAFHAFALSLPGAGFDVKWGDHRTYIVGGKMFAMAGALGEPHPRYTFKTSEMAFELLIEQGAAVAAPYLQRAKWVQLKAHDSLGHAELQAYVRQSHALIASKLTKAERRAIGMA